MAVLVGKSKKDWKKYQKVNHPHVIKPYAKQARQRQQRQAQQRAYNNKSAVGKIVYNVSHSRAGRTVSRAAKSVYRNVSHEIRRESVRSNNDPKRAILSRNKTGNKVVQKAAKSSVGRAAIGASRGFANGVTLGAADLAAKSEGYKNYRSYRRVNVRTEALTKEQDAKLRKSKAYKRGYAAGDMASYAVGYSGAGKAIGKGAAKVAGSKLGRKAIAKATKAGVEELGKGTVKAAERAAVRTGEKATAKAVERGAVKRAASKATGKVVSQTVKANVKAEVKAAAKEAGKKMTRQEVKKETAKRLAKMSAKEARGRAGKAAGKIGREIAKDAVGDLTVGAAMDNAHELQNGVTPLKKGKDGKYHVNKQYVKDMGVNAAQNVAIGGVMDTVPGMLKGAAKTAKKGKKATKTIERLGPDGKVHKVKVARSEGEEAVTHAAEKARHSEAGKKGAVTRRHNLVKKRAAEAEAEWHKTPADDLGPAAQRYARAEDRRNLSYRSKARPLDIDTPRNQGKSVRELARERLTQRSAFKESKNAVQRVKKSPSEMLKEQDFVEHLKDEKVNARTLAERAAKNGTTPGEELTKEHQKFTAEKVRNEFETKRSGEATVSKTESVQQGAGKPVRDRINELQQQRDELDDTVTEAARNLELAQRKHGEARSLEEIRKYKNEYIGAMERQDALRIEQEKLESSVKDGTLKDTDAAPEYELVPGKDGFLEAREKSPMAQTQAASVQAPKADTTASVEQGKQIAAKQAEARPEGTYEPRTPEERAEMERNLRNVDLSDADEATKNSERLLFMPGKSIRETAKKFLNEATKAMVDSAIGVERAAKQYNDEMLSVLFNGYRNRVSRINEIVNGDGIFRVAEKAKEGTVEPIRTSKSLRQICEPIAKQGRDEWKAFQDYLDWRHEIERAKEGAPIHLNAVKELADKAQIKPKPRTVGPNKEWVATYPQEVYDRLSEIAKTKSDQLAKDHPHFKEYEEEIRNYIHEVNELRVESGVWSEADLKHWEEKYPHYIPTHRTDLDLEGGRATAKAPKDSTVVSSSTGIKTATGSERNRIPLQDDLASWTSEAINSTTFNDFAVRLMQDTNESKMLKDIKPVDPDKVAKGEAFEFKKDKNGNGMIVPGTIKDDGKGNFTMVARENGKAYEFTVDKDIFDAVRWQQKPIKDLKFLKKANDVFRNLVTSWNPSFGLANGMRDFGDAPSYSKYGTQDFIKNYNRGAKMMAEGDPLWKLYKNWAGVSDDLVDITKEVSDKGFKRMQFEQTKFGKVPWAARSAVDKVMAMNGAIEQMPRFAEFLTTIEKECAKMPNGELTDDIVKQAVYNANEITENFSRSGYLGKWLNANGVTFLNAGIQDVNRTVKTLTKDRASAVRLLRNAAILGIAPSVFNEIMVGNDPNYQRLRTTDKDAYFYVPLGDGKYARLPKGRVVGTLASPAQRLTRAAMGNTDKREKWYTGMGKNAIENLAPNNPVESNLFAPFRAAALGDNKDQGKTWYGTPIVSSALSDKPPEEQYNENTTELAKWLGARLHKSPQKIDYILKQESGVIGQMLPATPGIGSLAKTGNGSAAEALLKTVGKQFTNRFYQDSVTNNKRSTQFYDRLDQLKMNSNSNKATQYDKLVYSFMNKKSGDLGDYNDQITKIESNKNLTAEEKLKQVRKIRLKQTKATERAMDMEKDYKHFYNKMKGDFNVNDYKDYADPKATMQKEMNKAITRAVEIKNGADPTEYDFKNSLSDKQRDEWKTVKKAGVSKKNYVNYIVTSKKNGSGSVGRAYSAIKSGANSYKAVEAMTRVGSTTGRGVNEGYYRNAKYLIKHGYTAKDIRKLSKATSGKGDTLGKGLALYKAGVHDYKTANALLGTGTRDLSTQTWKTVQKMHNNKDFRKYYRLSKKMPTSGYIDKAYVAIKAGADNAKEASNITGTTIYNSSWNKAVKAYNLGVSAKFVDKMANLPAYEKKKMQVTTISRSGNPYTRMDAGKTYRWVASHFKTRKERRAAWEMLKYDNKYFNRYSF